MAMNWREPFTSGDMFLKYRIDSLLGRGGHAVVYASVDTYLDRPVALKIIPPPMEVRGDVSSRGKQEARILSQIEHPNVVKVYDAGVTEEGVAYIAMELLEGRTLRAALQNLGPFSVLETMHIGIQIAEAVQAAHTHPKQAIHRDLKPENVFVLPGNAIKVLDFGISKLHDGNTTTTQPNVIRGTPQYMSPEQLEGRIATVQSDIFALGSILYELLVAVVPAVIGLKEISNFTIGYSQIQQIPPHLYELSNNIPRYVDRVIRCMLAKAPRERQASMTQVAAELRAIQKRFIEESSTSYLPLRELWQGKNSNVPPEMDRAVGGVHSATTAIGNVILTNQITTVVPSLRSNFPRTTRPMQPVAPPVVSPSAPQAVAPNSVTIEQPKLDHTPSPHEVPLSDSKEIVARAESLIAQRIAEQRSRLAPAPVQSLTSRSKTPSYSVTFLVMATLFGSGVGYGAILMMKHSGAAPASDVARTVERELPVVSVDERLRSLNPPPDAGLTQGYVQESANKPKDVPAVASSARAAPAIAQAAKKAAVPATSSAAPHSSARALWFSVDSDNSDGFAFRPKGGSKIHSAAKPAASATPSNKSTKKKDQLIFGADDLN